MTRPCVKKTSYQKIFTTLLVCIFAVCARVGTASADNPSEERTTANKIRLADEVARHEFRVGVVALAMVLEAKPGALLLVDALK